MWTVNLVDRTGKIVQVLLSGERKLQSAIAFAAGYGVPSVGAVVILPTAIETSEKTTIGMSGPDVWETDKLPTFCVGL